MTPIATQDPVLAAGAMSNGPDALYEIVDGQYVELPPMSTCAVRIASLLVKALEVFAEEHKLGRAVAEMLFALDAKGKLKRRPDVAFVSYARWAKGRRLPDTDPWMVVPELAIEVVSPNDLAEDLRKKVQEYFQAGAQLVWVVYPKLGLVDVYESQSVVRVRTLAEELDGGSVLPDLRLPVAVLFEEGEAE
ncbi:MAG TPA: Uma2 family endonuclease [Gemmataceae bacterium]|nr:Uma2 family endonuclease [Gemmataceae bacterium]